MRKVFVTDVVLGCRSIFLCALLAVALPAQAPNPVLPPGMSPRPLPPPPPPQQTPPAGQPTPAAQTPAAPAAQPPANSPTTYGGLTLNNVSLAEVVDMLARQLHLNYILDKRVQGGVMLNTYGETKNIDTRSLLEVILRINGFGMVQQGDLWRIVPLPELSHHPLPPEQLTNPKDIPADDRSMLNLVFLKYVTADQLVKVLLPFEGENASIYSYPPVNLLLILDSRRNMKRLMELIALFDNDALANQRVRLFETKNGRPSDLVKELETIVKSISLNEKDSPIKFLPVDRINTIIAVAPNPGAFGEVEKWLKKLDIPVKITAGATENNVYRVKYGNAVVLAMGIMMLYGGGGGYGMGMGYPGMGMGMGMGLGMGNMGQYGMGQNGMSPYGASPYGASAYGGSPYGGNMYGPQVPMAASPFAATPSNIAQPNVSASPSGVPSATGTSSDLTATYLGNAPVGGGGNSRLPRVVPNPFSNTLMIQSTPQDYEQIVKLLREMDVPPRQVLIDARIYEVDLSNSFSTSVSATFWDKGTSTDPAAHHFVGSVEGATTSLTDGFLVGRTKELLASVKLLEGSTKAKVISAPSVIATDSIAAMINVGVEVPTLTAQAVTGAQQNGTSLFANTVSNVNTGVTLNVTAQVNPSGIVTLMINQDVSAPQAAAPGGIQSPSFSKRSVQTQVTVQDGDTIAIGGIITESNTFTTSGLPFLNRLPVIGAAFGSRVYSKQRTELIIFMTPHVIFDTNQVQEASQQLQDSVKHLQKMIREQ